MYRYGHFGFHDGPGLIGWLFVALFAALVVLAVIAVVRALRGPGGTRGLVHFMPQHGPGIDPALQELRLRYARGDISWEEYAQRAANLGLPIGPGPAPGGPGAPPSPPA